MYDRASKFVADDAVFGVKESLVVDFQSLEGDPQAQLQLKYDFRLVSLEQAHEPSIISDES